MASRRGSADDVLPAHLARATLELLADVGVEALTLEDVAVRAGTDPAAVRRRWSTATTLVVLAVRGCRLVPAVPDTGTLRRDLEALLHPWTRPLDRCERAAAALLLTGRHRRELRTALEDGVVTPLAAAVTAITDREGRRSPSPHHADTDRLLQVVVQALWWERYTGCTAPLSAGGVAHLVDDVLVPITATG